jgi:predicted nucleotidyltransferase
MKCIEGDFIENSDGAFFDVKGLVHPPSRTVAFIRYFPSEKGDRKKQSLCYDKVYSFSERYSFLKERYPHYLVHDAVFDEMLCEVPDRDMKKRYKPV